MATWLAWPLTPDPSKVSTWKDKTSGGKVSVKKGTDGRKKRRDLGLRLWCLCPTAEQLTIWYLKSPSSACMLRMKQKKVRDYRYELQCSLFFPAITTFSAQSRLLILEITKNFTILLDKRERKKMPNQRGIQCKAKKKKKQRHFRVFSCFDSSEQKFFFRVTTRTPGFF